ncbi:MAG TPA: phosphoenolpyruvate--protein phosphotransferase [Gammaproteobacteria bacterium]
MLDTLRRIVQEVNDAKDLAEALGIIVQRVKSAMGVDLCSVYLTDHARQQNVLMATDGLNPESVGKVALNFNQGLTGLVGQREEVVNIADSPSHPRYQFVPESGEEKFHAYLGVPIIHHRKLLGVLVVQRQAKEAFDEDQVTFLITIAAQLSGAIAHAEASGGTNVVQQTTARSAAPVMGQPGSPGVGVGTAFVIYPAADLDAIPDRKIQDIEKEVQVFRTAVDGVRQDIKSLVAKLDGRLPAEDRALFDAYLLMLDKESLAGDVIKRIREGNWASGALRESIRIHLRAFEEMEDPYLRERGEDVRDLGRRILVRLQTGGDAGPRNYPRNTILVGEEITAAMLAEVPITQLSGVVSVTGSRTSHVAILARAMGIAAVMGADVPVSRMDGLNVIVDGYRGQIYISPNLAVLEEFNRLAREEQELSADLASLQDLPSETPDGKHISLHINSGLLADLIPKETNGAEGIGLYRTEFPFMVRDRFPGEEEQFQIYRQVLQSFNHGPVTLRTLDVGGDKALPYFPIAEDNPFLGWRGIRITLDHPEIFLVQLRAMLRASEGLDNMQLLLPMINSVHEVDDSLAILKRAYDELVDEGHKIVRPKVGVMIEVPSAVYLVREIARRVDFLSVGTNDLTQYLLAVDRNNSRVAESYDALHPAVLRALVQVVEGGHAEHKPVSVCGEMAGDPASAILLVGMEVDSLSMSVANLPRIKWVVRNFTFGRARRLLTEALAQESAATIRSNLNTVLEEAGLGGLVRGGR